MLELMARGCMRVGEVLKLTPKDIEDRKVIILDPKSGNEAEVAFLPQKVADRLKKYISDNGIELGDRIFPITYAAASPDAYVRVPNGINDLQGHQFFFVAK